MIPCANIEQRDHHTPRKSGDAEKGSAGDASGFCKERRQNSKEAGR